MSADLWKTLGGLIVTILGFFLVRLLNKNDNALSALTGTDTAQGKDITTLQADHKAMREQVRDLKLAVAVSNRHMTDISGFLSRYGFRLRTGLHPGDPRISLSIEGEHGDETDDTVPDAKLRGEDR